MSLDFNVVMFSSTKLNAKEMKWQIYHFMSSNFIIINMMELCNIGAAFFFFQTKVIIIEKKN